MQLRVRSNGSLLWNFNYREPVTKKRINMGFGTYPELSLANARKKAVEARELLAQGIDPKVQRNTLNETQRAETEHTFENVALARLSQSGTAAATVPRGHAVSSVTTATYSSRLKPLRLSHGSSSRGNFQRSASIDNHWAVPDRLRQH